MYFGSVSVNIAEFKAAHVNRVDMPKNSIPSPRPVILPLVTLSDKMHLIDNIHNVNWSEKIFQQMREVGVDASHLTIAYHEMFR